MNSELLNKVKGAKSAEELMEIANAGGASVTLDQAKSFFEKINAKGELSDDELDTAVGGCGDGKFKTLVGPLDSNCALWKCKDCYCGRPACKHYRTEGRHAYCNTCAFCSYEKGVWYCYNDELNKKHNFK